jgi:hypothetical protein
MAGSKMSSLAIAVVTISGQRVQFSRCSKQFVKNESVKCENKFFRGECRTVKKKHLESTYFRSQRVVFQFQPDLGGGLREQPCRKP